MSTMTYGSITLPYCYAMNFEQSAVGDDMGDTDKCYTKFDITVQATISTDYMPLVSTTLAAIGGRYSPAQIMATVREELMKRRQRLSYRFNGVDLIPPIVDGNRGPVDAKNGPVPQFCNIVELNNTTFLVVFRIIAHYADNTFVQSSDTDITITNRRGSPVLYNRWSESVDIDNCNYTKRIREGKFLLRSDSPDGLIVDLHREEFAILGVPEGFIRESSYYKVSPDGLALQYRIVDKEVFKMPPANTFEAEGFYRESCANQGTNRTGHVRVVVKGDKDSLNNQVKVLNSAVGVCVTKLDIVGIAVSAANQIPITDPKKKKGMLVSASITVDLYNNVVAAEMIALFPHFKRRFKGIGLLNTDMTVTPGSTRASPVPKYRDRGTAYMVLQAAAYYDKNIVANALDPITGQMNRGKEVGVAGKEGEP